MKKVIRLTESDIRRIVKKTLTESTVDVSGIVHKHIDSFVNQTIDSFLDVMSKISDELSSSGVMISSHFYEAEMHFEEEMLNLSEEISHKIHEDEQIKHHIETTSSNDSSQMGH